MMQMIMIDSEEKWNECFKQNNFSNLLQAWKYGDAKAKIDRWIVRRGIIKNNDVEIALCQWLEKPIFKFFKIIRINRGPLHLNVERSNHDEIRSLHHFIAKYFSLRKGCVLLIAPELENTTENQMLLKELKYRKQKRYSAWQSSIVDLQQSEQELRANLRGRLRNYLKHAENKNFTFEILFGETHFYEALSRYEVLQKQKNFSGVSVMLLKELFHLHKNDINMFVALVKNNIDEILAIQLSVIHGNQCTPLIAWTSFIGSKCHAMHWVIWKSLLYLKERGVHYYDVGGYNNDEHASVSQFKKGFGGREYCLAGEYYRIF